MKSEMIDFKSKAWGIVGHPRDPLHFHTGYEGEWNRDHWELMRTIGPPKSNMIVGKNVILTGRFRVTGSSRGRSAANFAGHFLGHEAIEYTLSMEGMTELMALLQDEKFPLIDRYMEGRFTIAKQGQSFFLKPAP